MSFGARALIRLAALDHNLDILKSRVPDARVMAVIKANAYGHGMIPVAHHLHHADSFAVARLPEAVQLREAGIEQPIVLLSGARSKQELREAAEYRCEVVVHCPEQVEFLDTETVRQLTAWLKVDTGMNRLGFRPEDAAHRIEQLQNSPTVGEVRLMTHIASADDPSNPSTAQQLDAFRSVANGFAGSISIANSPTMLGFSEIPNAAEEFGFRGEQWIRPGIAMYGISPYPGRTAAEFGLKPVMQFEAKLIAKKPLTSGSRVGYTGRYISDKDTTLGIISAGYGDGYTRHFRDGTPVLLNGRRVSLIGNVSMDMIAVDLGQDSNDRVGDTATLWGDDLPVEEVAPFAGTIPYELVCGVSNREDSEVVV